MDMRKVRYRSCGAFSMPPVDRCGPHAESVAIALTL